MFVLSKFLVLKFAVLFKICGTSKSLVLKDLRYSMWLINNYVHSKKCVFLSSVVI